MSSEQISDMDGNELLKKVMHFFLLSMLTMCYLHYK